MENSINFENARMENSNDGLNMHDQLYPPLDNNSNIDNGGILPGLENDELNGLDADQFCSGNCEVVDNLTNEHIEEILLETQQVEPNEELYVERNVERLVEEGHTFLLNASKDLAIYMIY